mmetsp:Transcript_53339/g.96062  ORF Transcript_53339/g.96062 Transcript_53339/m.96062 type:complete len:277 (-) Transcript_53339:327-1157(-)
MHGLLEGFDEEPADDLSLGLWFGHSCKLSVEVVGFIKHRQLHSRDVLLQTHLHDFRLVSSKKTCVHHEGLELIADGFENQGGRNARVHAAANSSHHVFVLSLDLGHDSIDLSGAKVMHVPLTLAADNLQAKVLDNLRTTRCVGHLWMELHPVKVSLLVLHSCKLATICVGDGVKAVRKGCHLVAVTHPNWHLVTRDVLEERAAALGLLGVAGLQRHVVPHYQFCVAELALQARLDLSTVDVADLLQAVADTQHRQLQLVNQVPDLFEQMRAVRVIH